MTVKGQNNLDSVIPRTLCLPSSSQMIRFSAKRWLNRTKNAPIFWWQLIFATRWNVLEQVLRWRQSSDGQRVHQKNYWDPRKTDKKGKLNKKVDGGDFHLPPQKTNTVHDPLRLWAVKTKWKWFRSFYSTQKSYTTFSSSVSLLNEII